MSETFWITKYALTKGIQVLPEGELEPSGMVYNKNDRYFVGYKLGRDAFRTEWEAVQAANVMRQNKIASLQKQIRKLESARFVVSDRKV